MQIELRDFDWGHTFLDVGSRPGPESDGGDAADVATAKRIKESKTYPRQRILWGPCRKEDHSTVAPFIFIRYCVPPQESSRHHPPRTSVGPFCTSAPYGPPS